METPIRIFNQAGIEQFRAALQNIKDGVTNELPEKLLFDPALSSIVAKNVKVDYQKFATALEMVEYLHPLIIAIPLNDKFYNPGLWAWLTTFYFDVICPFENGRRKVGEEVRYIPSIRGDHRRDYHLLAAPMRTYDTHGMNRSKLFLYSTIDRFPRFLNLISSRQDLAMSSGVLDALNLLYWDEKQARPKASATGSLPGSLDRFITLMNQFNRTYDLQGMTGEQIVALLPKKEFGRWFTKEEVPQFAFDFDD